jgi:hypothetical protein
MALKLPQFRRHAGSVRFGDALFIFCEQTF